MIGIHTTFSQCHFTTMKNQLLLQVGLEHGFEEMVQRAKGKYDILWKVNNEKHFLDEENVLSKFLPFVNEILGTSFTIIIMINLY